MPRDLASLGEHFINLIIFVCAKINHCKFFYYLPSVSLILLITGFPPVNLPLQPASSPPTCGPFPPSAILQDLLSPGLCEDFRYVMGNMCLSRRLQSYPEELRQGLKWERSLRRQGADGEKFGARDWQLGCFFLCSRSAGSRTTMTAANGSFCCGGGWTLGNSACDKHPGQKGVRRK